MRAESEENFRLEAGGVKDDTVYRSSQHVGQPFMGCAGDAFGNSFQNALHVRCGNAPKHTGAFLLGFHRFTFMDEGFALIFSGFDLTKQRSFGVIVALSNLSDTEYVPS
ncbi:MAG: hypothetical protein LBP99_02885 [Azoarcus sp.]|jgi:hypothetical protein|nr:hypothetical protein [Azoarcus sp.]